MKLAHVAIATPGRCGLYETTRELVAAERKAGVDARIIDPSPGIHGALQVQAGQIDRGVPIVEVGWAKHADVLVDHSGLDTPGLSTLQKPVIMVAHGRPQSSFLGEMKGQAPVISYWYKKNRDPRYKAVVTFWPEHMPFLEAVWDQTEVRYVPPIVDLDAWTPGETPYAFLGKGGSPNVVIADMWREDITPFACLTAFLRFAEDSPNAKLHIFGLPEERKGINAYLKVLLDRGHLGVAQGFTKGLINAYRKADLVLSPQTIYTRSLREAMACNCRVVSFRDVPVDDVEAMADAMHEALEREPDSRIVAESLFDASRSAKAFLSIAEEVRTTPLAKAAP